jgi:CheY-like chemotaxis protein
MARRQFLQLTRVVDDLLDVARVTEGRIDLQREKLEVSEIIAHALEMVEPLARAKEHEISVTNVGFQPLYINADRARILQCVVNVLTNAVKYTDHGGRIQLQTRMDASDVLIEVTDSGVGIAADLLPNVFELFVQGARTLDRSQGGLGIGLALVKRLAEMHEGSASARSAGAGQGSTFEIRLPATERPAPTRRRAATARLPTKRVLVVDDNRDLADSLSTLLRIDGYEVGTAYAPKDALELAISFKPAVILLDIGLPGMDGYEVARRLKHTASLKGVRVVALTGYGKPEDRRRAREAGFDAHLVKPVELAELKRSLN